MNPETREKLWAARHGTLGAMSRSHAQPKRMLLSAQKRLVAIDCFAGGADRKKVNAVVHKQTGGSPASPMLTAVGKVIKGNVDPLSIINSPGGHLVPTPFELQLIADKTPLYDLVVEERVMYDGLGRLIDWKDEFRPVTKPVEPEEPVLEKEPEEPVLTDEEIQAKLDEIVVAKPVTTNGLTWPELKEMISQGSNEESLFELAVAAVQGNVDGFLLYLVDQVPTLYDDIETGLEDRGFAKASKTQKADKVFDWMEEEGWGHLRFVLPEKRVGVVKATEEVEPEVHFVEEVEVEDGLKDK